MQVRTKDAVGRVKHLVRAGFHGRERRRPHAHRPVRTEPTLAQPADPPLLTWSPVAGATDLHGRGRHRGRSSLAPATYTTEATAMIVARQPGTRRRQTLVRARQPRRWILHGVLRRSARYMVLPIAQPDDHEPGQRRGHHGHRAGLEPVARARNTTSSRSMTTSTSAAGELVPEQDLRHPVLTARRRSATTSTSGGCGRATSTTTPRSGSRLRRRTTTPSTGSGATLPQLVHPLDAEGGPEQTATTTSTTSGRPSARLALRAVAQHRPELHRADHDDSAVLGGRDDVHAGRAAPSDACMPDAEGAIYYWKVRLMDRRTGRGVAGIFSDTQRFVYER